MPVFGLLHPFGLVVRGKTGTPGWVNPEFDVMM
jgi:hypothetical protein